MASNPLIRLRGIGKRFGGVQALDNVALEVDHGEVHALVGENGAGKSTLGKIIAGVARPDEGELLIDGQTVAYGSPREALLDGITIVEQELALVPAMTVVDNVVLGTHRRGDGLRRGKAARRYVEQLNQDFGLELQVSAPVEHLAVADQQKVEILRALARNARVIVMDEPTARLSAGEAGRLLAIIRRLSDGGTAIIYVSHYLEEVLSIADRVTVLRNGHLIRTSNAEVETEDTLVQAMLGRPATLVFPPKQPPPSTAAIVLTAKNLSGGVTTRVNDVSLEVRAGEIVGIAGLVGSGRSELAHVLFAAERRDGGSIELAGEPFEVRTPREAIRRGMAFVPESRKEQGLLAHLSTGKNVTLPHLRHFTRMGLISGSAENRGAGAILRDLGVRPADPRVRLGTLSGGNQQKTLFAKWLFGSPRLLIVDEPTRGVDVGAKFAIYELLVKLASDGLGVLLISSELEEIVGLSHRVIVMRRGRLVAELGASDVSEETVMRAAFGGTKATQPIDDQTAPVNASTDG